MATREPTHHIHVKKKTHTLTSTTARPQRITKPTKTKTKLDNRSLATKLDLLKKDFDELQNPRKRERRSVTSNKENEDANQIAKRVLSDATRKREAEQAEKNAEIALKLTQKLARAEDENTKLREKCELMELSLAEERAKLRRIMEKQVQEQKEKRELFNLVQELKGNIRVFVRVRPILSADGDTVSSVRCIGEQIHLQQDKLQKSSSFEFERVFGSSSNQEDVFAEVKAMATSLLDGYNVCIFAYGQTGSGKTYTMEGTPTDPGVNYRLLQELFERISWRSDEYTFQVNVGVLEVYNETIVDLLSKKKEKVDVSIVKHQVSVPNMTWVPVTDYNHVVQVMQEGSKNRSVGSNNLNEHSSRSHCILTLRVTSTHVVTQATSTSKLYLIDLAGSERLKRTGTTGDREKESVQINKSLSALGDVFSALSQKSSHVPYRNSKLTSLLQDSLVNGSKVLMLVNVSPSQESAPETLCSLNFATRTRQVEVGKLKKNK